MGACDGPDGVDKSIWPPVAPNDCWPATRIGGATIAGAMIILCLIPYMWPHFKKWLFWSTVWGSFFFSAWLAVWVHFVPCFWWSCDWGFYDGQGIRGGILFGVWIFGWLGFGLGVRFAKKADKATR